MAHSDLFYRFCIRRDMRRGIAGEVASHDIESGSGREGDGDDEGEKESAEEEDGAEEEGTSGHHCGGWRMEVNMVITGA